MDQGIVQRFENAVKGIRQYGMKKGIENAVTQLAFFNEDEFPAELRAKYTEIEEALSDELVADYSQDECRRLAEKIEALYEAIRK